MQAKLLDRPISQTTLKACAYRLAEVILEVILEVLLEVIIEVILVPKKPNMSCLNNSLTMLTMTHNSFFIEQLTLYPPCPPHLTHPLQFAYRPNRSANDAIAFALCTALSHLGMLLIDYSLAFDTRAPSRLITKTCASIPPVQLDPGLPRDVCLGPL